MPKEFDGGTLLMREEFDSRNPEMAYTMMVAETAIEVARHSGLTVEQVVNAHVGAVATIAGHIPQIDEEKLIADLIALVKTYPEIIRQMRVDIEQKRAAEQHQPGHG